MNYNEELAKEALKKSKKRQEAERQARLDKMSPGLRYVTSRHNYKHNYYMETYFLIWISGPLSLVIIIVAMVLLIAAFIDSISFAPAIITLSVGSIINILTIIFVHILPDPVPSDKEIEKLSTSELELAEEINENWKFIGSEQTGEVTLSFEDEEMTPEELEQELKELEELKKWSAARYEQPRFTKDEALEELKNFSARINSPEYKLKMKEQEELRKRLAPRSK